jgi:hypothetical protein
MPEYTYRKSYQDLESKRSSLENKFRDLFENDSRKDELLLWMIEYKETHESILEMSNQEIEDVEWDKNNEIEDIEDEVKSLESKIEDLEKKNELFDVQSLEDEMKVELFQAAMKKYTLTQLEEKLGNKFQLI